MQCALSKLGTLHGITTAWCERNCRSGSGEFAPACNPETHSDHLMCKCDNFEHDRESVETTAVRGRVTTAQPRSRSKQIASSTTRNSTNQSVETTVPIKATAASVGIERDLEHGYNDGSAQSGPDDEDESPLEGGEALLWWMWTLIVVAVLMICVLVLVVRRKLGAANSNRTTSQTASPEEFPGKPGDVQINGTWDRLNLGHTRVQHEDSNEDDGEAWGHLGTALMAEDRWSTSPPGSPCYQEPVVFGLQEYAEIDDSSSEIIVNGENSCRRHSQLSASPDYELVKEPTPRADQAVRTQPQQHRNAEGYASIAANQRYLAPAFSELTQYANHDGHDYADCDVQEYADCDGQQQSIYEYDEAIIAVGTTENARPAAAIPAAAKLRGSVDEAQLYGTDLQNRSDYRILDDAMVQVSIRRRSSPLFYSTAPQSSSKETTVYYMRDADRRIGHPSGQRGLYFFDRTTAMPASGSTVPSPIFIGEGPRGWRNSGTSAQHSATSTAGINGAVIATSPGAHSPKWKPPNSLSTALDYDQLVSENQGLRSQIPQTPVGINSATESDVGAYDRFRSQTPVLTHYESMAD